MKQKRFSCHGFKDIQKRLQLFTQRKLAIRGEIRHPDLDREYPYYNMMITSLANGESRMSCADAQPKDVHPEPASTKTKGY